MENSKIGSSSKAHKPGPVDSGATSADINNAEPTTKKTRVDISQVENAIFYNENYLSEKQKSIKFKPKITEVDEKKFKSLENFQTFITDTEDNFLEIKDEFVAEINEFKDLCLFYISAKDRSKFEDEINELIPKIANMLEYHIHEDSILVFFRDIRPQISIINKILKQIKSEKIERRPKCLIDVDQVQDLINGIIIGGMGVCLDGVGTRITSLHDYLLARFTGTEALIYGAKQGLATSLAEELERQLEKDGKLIPKYGYSVHRNNAFKNAIAKDIAIEEVNDRYTQRSGLSEDNIDEFIKDAKFALLPINIVKYLVDNFYNSFLNTIQEHNCSDILTDNGIALNKINAGFTGNIGRLIKDFNNFYGAANENQIISSDLIEYFYVEDTEYLKITNLETKLHAYVSRSLLPDVTKSILLSIPHHDFPSNRELKIASIANCYFEVVEEQSPPQNIFVDVKSQTNLQLKHITSNLIAEKQLPVETYQPLIIQALRQTNNSKEIIDFFLNDNIKELLQEDNNIGFKTYLSKIITNKTEGNPKLKQQLGEEICTDSRMITKDNKVNIENDYWLIETPLLESLLFNKFTANLNYLRYLLIQKSGDLKTKESLKKLYEDSRNNIEKRKLFDETLIKLMMSDDANTVVALLCSGLVNNLLQNNSQLLLSLAKKNNYRYLNLIFEINNKLAPNNKFNLNDVEDIKDGRTLLMHVSEKGDNDVLEMLINQGACVSQQNFKEGNTALMIAVKNKNYECMKTLIKHQADINDQDRLGWTALMYADDTSFNMLMKTSRVSVNTQNKEGDTALMIAVKNKNYERMKTLIEYRADIDYQDSVWEAILYGDDSPFNIRMKESRVSVNTQNEEGDTALMIAVMYADDTSFNILMKESSVSVNTQNKEGDTALTIAVKNGNNQYINTLLEHGVNINDQDKLGSTALMHAASGGHDTCVRILIEKSADVNIQNHKERKTALMLAAENGMEECMKVLIANKADIEARDHRENTALMRAAENGMEECMKVLIANKADIEAQDHRKNTALMFAAENGMEECMKVLLDNKADMEVQDSSENTALMRAVLINKTECCNILIKAGANINTQNYRGITPLMQAILLNNTELARTIIDNKEFDINIADGSDRSALSYALEAENREFSIRLFRVVDDIYRRIPLMEDLTSENTDLAGTLIEKDVDVERFQKTLNDALASAAKSGKHEYVEILLNKYGADVNARDKLNRTPLISATRKESEKCVTILIHHDAIIDLQDTFGNTALMKAIQTSWRHTNILKILLENKPNTELQNEDGHTALSLARKLNNKKGEDIIVKHIENNRV